jgi:hypothetical protein
MMAPETPNDSTVPKPTLQDGVESLWKFQLRKENAALLERQELSIKQLEKLVAETSKNKRDFDERIEALETTVLNLKNEEKKDRLAIEKYCEEMAGLSSQMEGIMDKLETFEACREEMGAMKLQVNGVMDKINNIMGDGELGDHQIPEGILSSPLLTRIILTFKLFWPWILSKQACLSKTQKQTSEVL